MGEKEQVYLLNAGQYPCWESVNAAAKYAKFAYSSRFGFCVSHSSYDLGKTGCDSSLLLSEGDGYWRERRKSRDRYSSADLVLSTWEPWPDVSIRTWLLPIGPWHVRVHEIESGRDLECAEGGFSLPDLSGFEGPVAPRLEAKSFRCFFSTATGWGTVTLGASELRIDVVEGELAVDTLRLTVGKSQREIAAGVVADCAACRYIQRRANSRGAAAGAGD